MTDATPTTTRSAAAGGASGGLSTAPDSAEVGPAAGLDDAEAAKIGRFTLLRRIGAGGMGVVWAAYDGQLDRKVALKVIREDRPEFRGRIAREAQALAKLSHPHVVPVYEVGLHGARLFLAMEFVRGETLRRYAAGHRSVRELLGVYRQAALGLCAAHEAGLVHRDFKPDNAIVGNDGRVRVLDFGLARHAGDPIEPARAAALAAARPSDADASSTVDATDGDHGAWLGTPAYMAPEQILGDRVDARADQFAFAAALFEALYGERPYAGKTRSELVANVTRGQLREPARRAAVPRWLHRVLVRALAVDPQQRWPSMAAMIEALDADPARRQRVFGVTAMAVVGAIAVVGGLQLREAAAQRACDDEAAAITAAWDDDARARAEAGMLATAKPYAPDSFARAAGRLDGYATALAAAARQACVAATIEHSHDAAHHAQARECIDERRRALSLEVDRLAQADADTALGAVLRAMALPAVDDCSDEARLQQRVLPPDELAAGVAALREQAVAIDAMTTVGRYEEALAPALRHRDDAVALGWAPQTAAALLRLAGVYEGLARYHEARALGEEAFFVALADGRDHVAAEAAILLVSVLGDRLRRPAEADAWALLATTLLDRMAGRGDEILRGMLARNQMHVALAAAQCDPVLEYAQQSAAQWTRALGPDHPRVAVALDGVAHGHLQRGDFAAALEPLQGALAIAEAIGEHPIVAQVYEHIATARLGLGELDAAAAAIARSLHIHQRTHGLDNAFAYNARMIEAQLAAIDGEFARARSLTEAARAALGAALGPDTVHAMKVEVVLGQIALGEGDTELALRHFEGFRALIVRYFGADTAPAAEAELALAIAHERRRDHGQALRAAEHGLALLAAAPSCDPRLPLQLTAQRGRSLAALGRTAEARAPLEQAIAGLEGAPGFRLDVAMTRFALAQLDAAVPAGRAGALALARSAAAELRALGRRFGAAQYLPEVETWLAAQTPEVR